MDITNQLTSMQSQMKLLESQIRTDYESALHIDELKRAAKLRDQLIKCDGIRTRLLEMEQYFEKEGK